MRPTTDQGIENKRLHNSQPKLGHIYYTTPSKVSEIIVEERVERAQEPREVDNYKKTPYSAHIRTAARVK